MAVSAATGSFDTPSAGTRTVSGLGFQPKAVIFLLTPRKTVGVVEVFNNVLKGYGLGFSTGPGAGNNAMYYGATENTDDARRTRSVTASGELREFSTGTSRVRFEVTAFGPDGFTVTILDANTNPYRVDYLALGGSDITGAKIVTFDDPTTVSTLTVSGVGFQPKAVIFGDAWTGNGPELDEVSLSSSIRWQTSLLSQQGAGSMCVTHTALSGVGACTSSLRTDRALAYQHNTSSSLVTSATLAGFTNDGFQLAYDTVFASTTRRTALCLGGRFQAAVGAFTEPGSASVVDTPLSFVARAAFLMSQGRAPTTAVSGNSTPHDIPGSWGVWSPVGGHRSLCIAERVTVGPTVANNCLRTSDSQFEVVQPASSSSLTIRGRFDLDQSPPGILRRDHSIVSGTGMETMYMVFGDAPRKRYPGRRTR